MGRASKDRNSQPLTRADRRAVPKITGWESKVQRPKFNVQGSKSVSRRRLWALDVGPWTFLDSNHFEIRIHFLFEHSLDRHQRSRQ
jgi:hypothetical protein